MLYTVDNEKYIDIIKKTNNLYNSVIGKYNDNGYDEKEKAKDIYIRYSDKLFTKDEKVEKQLFYLNLLVNDNKKALNELIDLYHTYFEVDNSEKIKPFEYYQKYFEKKLYNDKTSIIIEYFKAYYELTQQEAYFKISELIQYYDVIKGLYKKKNNDNTQSKEKQIDNKKSDEIDLLKIMRESHHNNQFEYFEQPDKSSKAR